MSRQAFSIFDQMLEGVQVIGKNSQYLYVNEAAVVHSTKSKEDLLGKTMQECYPGIENTPVYKRVQECFATGKSQEWINEFDFPNSTKGFFQLRIIPLNEAVLIMSFDVTNQKKAEALIENTNNYLEEVVKTRTEELLEQNVIIDRQLQYLKDLNKTKDKFFSIVAHDLMAPLRSIRGLTNLLRSGAENISQIELVKTTTQLHDSVHNTLVLAENLIVWANSQMQSNQTAKMEQVPISEMITEVYGLYKELAERKGVDLNYSVDTGLMVAADKNQLSFVVRNLVNNAIKYTRPTGSIKITAGIHKQNRVHISVRDDGIGIPLNTIENIRGLGMNGSTNGTMGEKGTGLGLALCKEFVELNNGHIEIESSEGQGSTFRVLLDAWN